MHYLFLISRIFLLVILLSVSALPATSFASTPHHPNKKAKDSDKKKEPENPCSGFLSIVDRPSVADSVCVVPLGHAVLETGYLGASLQGGGFSHSFPQAEVRFGIPANNEVDIILPTYIHQTIPIENDDGDPLTNGNIVQTGSTAVTIGLKHFLGYTEHWSGAIEAYVTPPSGSYYFGQAGFGAAFYGLAGYSFNSQLSLTLMLGASTQTLSKSEGGTRFSSFNPDLVLSWQPHEKWQLYAEIYGQSATGPCEGPGFVGDVGIQYLINKNLEVDLAVAQTITGNLGGFNRYITSGFAVMF